ETQGSPWTCPLPSPHLTSSSDTPRISQARRRPPRPPPAPQPCSPQHDTDAQECPKGQASSGHQEGGQRPCRRVLH
ncbi:unnamed protein product, partial [Gulo gulo]